MAKYKVLEPSFVDGFLIDANMIAAKGADGYIVEYAGEVSDNLELVTKDPGDKQKANLEVKSVQDALRAEAIAGKLTEDGKPGGKLIDKDTPIDVVKTAVATAKQMRTN